MISSKQLLNRAINTLSDKVFEHHRDLEAEFAEMKKTNPKVQRKLILGVSYEDPSTPVVKSRQWSADLL
jgi:hypothetical protein